MVAGLIAGVLRRALAVAAVFAALLPFPAAAQKQLTLEEVSARKPPDYSPAHSGETVTVRGVVSAPAYHFPGYTLVAIDDGRFGAVVAALRGPQPGSTASIPARKSRWLDGFLHSRSGTIQPSASPSPAEGAARSSRGF